MSDYNSSLPVRTEAAGDVDIFISDATVSTRKLKVNADGSICVGDGTDVLQIDGNGAACMKIQDSGGDVLNINADGSLNVTATGDFDIRDLSHLQDSIKIGDGTEFLLIDANGAACVKIQDSAGDVLAISATGEVSVTATDLDIRNLVAATDSVTSWLVDEAGNAFTSLNPLPVAFTSDQDGDEVVDYNTTASVAAAGTTNHDYTVTAAKTFIGEEIWVSGSGKLKVEVIADATGAPSTLFVGFNSTANPNIRIPLDRIPHMAATQVVRMTITNRDNQSQDVYSTLMGLEV